MDFTNPHFAEPQWLWLALLGPVLLAGLHRYAARARARQLARVASPHALTQLTASHSPARRRLKNGLLLLAVGGVGLALARPQWGEFESTDEWLGEDILFALDCSNSMLATDVRPSRLQRAKLTILDFVRQNGRGRVGLVAFAGGAFLQCPLTYDHEAFEDSLMAVDERTIPVAGTDIGRALKESDLAMEKKSRRKRVVLVTDGEDLEQSGVQVARSLVTNGIVVFTVGVGSPVGTEIQIINAVGQPELLRDAKGEVVRSRLDEETLRTIAQVTGGKYFALGARGDGLREVLSAVRALDELPGSTRVRKRGVERFHYPLALALTLIAVERLIGTRRRQASKNPAFAGSPVAAALVVFGLFVASTVSGATNAASNNVTHSAVAPAPHRPPVTARELYNAGTRKLAEGKLADAESLFQSAVRKQDERVQAVALYNLGQVRFAQGVAALEKDKDKSGGGARSRSRAAVGQGEQAIEFAEAALAERETQKMVAAYLNGRGARRELRGALKAVRRAMEIHGDALLKWRRALGDFRSAAELNPVDTNSVENVKVVEREIAKLVDSLREMQQLAMAMSGQASELNQLLNQLRGQIPADALPPGAPGDEGEEGDDGEEITPESLRGREESAGQEGRELERPLSPEEAGRLLDGFRLDGGRRLPMSGRETAEGKEGKGADLRPTRPW